MSNLVSPHLAESLVSANPLTVESRNPTMGMLALELLSQGQTWEEIRDATGFNFDQISRIRARHETAIEERKKALAQDGFEMAEGLRLLAKMKMEQLANNPEALAKTNLRDIVLPYAIAQDKALQALGEKKEIVEYRTAKPSLEDAMKAIEEARASARLKMQAESIEVQAKPVKEESK